MKQKRRGFTLIELLAVIVILAIIALIAVPVIMNIISSTRKSAFEDTAYGLISAGEMYYAEKLLDPNGMTEEVTFTFTDGAVSPLGLNIKGSLPKSGKLVVTTDGKTAIAISNGTYCITKGYEESKITITDEFESCDLPTGTSPVKTLSELAKTNDFATTVNACTTSGTCEPGTQFAIEVAPGEVKNFYVISDVDNTVTLIMDRNVDQETVKWITEEDYLTSGGIEDEWSYISAVTGNNNKGPITALNYLESKTSSWTNIPSKTYTVTDDGGANKYSLTRINARARMLTKTEVDVLIEGNNWLYGNLSEITSTGYWLSTASESDDWGAWFVDYCGIVVDNNGVPYGIANGVRPVIEISK